MAEEICDGCSNEYFKTIATFYCDDSKALKFFEDHGVTPSGVICPKCNRECRYREDMNLWRCGGSFLNPKNKRRKFCYYSVSHFKGSFLEGCSFPPWKLLIFINEFLRSGWNQNLLQESLELSARTIFTWNQFMCEVIDSWFLNQQAMTVIGGPDIVVEIGQGCISSCINWDKSVKQIRFFGGIERVSKIFFMKALEDEDQDECFDGGKLLPLVEKFVAKGSIIYSASGETYENISQLGYTHGMTKSAEASNNKEINTQILDCFWRDINKSVKKPGYTSKYLYQYITRYLFLKSLPQNQRLHRFLVEAARLYPPQGDRRRIDIHEDDTSDQNGDFNDLITIRF